MSKIAIGDDDLIAARQVRYRVTVEIGRRPFKRIAAPSTCERFTWTAAKDFIGADTTNHIDRARGEGGAAQVCRITNAVLAKPDRENARADLDRGAVVRREITAGIDRQVGRGRGCDRTRGQDRAGAYVADYQRICGDFTEIGVGQIQAAGRGAETDQLTGGRGMDTHIASAGVDALIDDQV